MSYDIQAFRGETAGYILRLYAADGIGSWLEGSETVEARYVHFDDRTAVVALSVLTLGSSSAPAIVALPNPCVALSPDAPAEVAPGPGVVIVTKSYDPGGRESMPRPLTYAINRE